ncbi:unnamed protein product [Lactuca virosa]|uniref:Uncharacterized protein n=1 Tax=Lactuca virosa TaxID=75947 RepID=A0AAU9MKK0_9ASTR|nr:unnamed protein product [Lactuca virosa]
MRSTKGLISLFSYIRLSNCYFRVEEGGVIGDLSSNYLWCVDPLDGAIDSGHGYPSFAVSVRVLFKGKPATTGVVEFVRDPMCWNTHTFSAVSGVEVPFVMGKKFMLGDTDKVERSLLVVEFGYEHDGPCAANMNLFKEFTTSAGEQED